MRFIAPRCGLPEVTLAENQPEYLPVTVGLWHSDEAAGVLLRVKPSAGEIEQLKAGQDLFISLSTFGQPMQPISIQVGSKGWDPESS